MKPKLWSIGMMLMSFLFIGLSQSVSASSFQSYVKDTFYLGVGGVPPTLEDFAVNPRAYLRSEAAFQSLKQGFETPLNRSLSDAEFSALLASDRVRAELDCVGRITTAGITQAGAIGWSSRDCYFDEKLIELKVDNRWYVVASQGCFNLVESQIEMTPADQEINMISGSPLLQSPKVFVQETRGIVVHSCDCPNNHGCHSDIYLPSYRGTLVR
jgi:hypothetical protein